MKKKRYKFDLDSLKKICREGKLKKKKDYEKMTLTEANVIVSQNYIDFITKELGIKLGTKVGADEWNLFIDYLMKG